jgi:hypothetical protein
LFRLGLRRFPHLDVIINLAASQDASVRQQALNYLIENITSKYEEYNPVDFSDVPYVPAVDGGENACMGTPAQVRFYHCPLMPFTYLVCEVFSNPKWAALGFLTVHPGLRGDALAKLKITEHPPPPRLVLCLSNTYLSTETQAKKWFRMLAICVPGTY